MTRKQRLAAGITAVAAVAAAAGAAGIASAVGPADGDRQTPRAGGSTVVNFTDSAVEALSPLNPTGNKPGAFGISPSGLAVQAVLPVVGNSSDGTIEHVGGLTLTDGTNILTLRNYTIDTTSGVLTASGFVNGSKLGKVDFLDVELTDPATGCDASANLTLAAPAADALTALFDAPNLTGADIGTACVDLR